MFYQALAKDAGATYNINKQGCAVLPKQKLEGCFDRAGADFTGTTALRLHLVAFGRGNNLASITAVQPVIEANEASYAHGDLTEWWRVLPIGFEQGFTIAKRPSGDGYLTLALAASRQDAGAPTISHSREGGNPVKTSPSIPLRSEGGKEIAWGNLRYGQLVVTDANGKVVPATFRVAQDREQARSRGAGERILIAVNDAHAAYPLTVDPLVWAEAQKVTASDGGRDDQFGYAVALSGTTALVGAPGHSEGGGAAYVFGEAGGSWTQTAELLAQANVGSLCGTSVALSGTRALLGCPDPGFPGGVVVFSESGGTWTRTAFLQPSDSEIQDDFGYSVAFSGTTALVGAPGHEINQGVAYVFGDSGGIWAQTAELVASDGAAGDEFGWSVALDGSTALIGAPSHDGQGTAYVFAPSGATWVQAAELAASDGAAGDQFGDSVALDGATALVGAYNHVSQGAAYVFGESGGSWTQTAEFAASDGVAGDEFGYSVALSGTTAFVGAPYSNYAQGAAYDFDESGG
ncbi:MAG TPA: FG-GAP repeat protein, partial [Gammaproteobacteria bacterium]|nr:FG-GAP repeat protein [Gammaproteobacteria bacterium]